MITTEQQEELKKQNIELDYDFVSELLIVKVNRDGFLFNSKLDPVMLSVDDIDMFISFVHTKDDAT